jgi:hypothetical protein
VSPLRTIPCRHDIDTLLHRRADGRLSAAELEALDRQLGGCPACRERAALLGWLSDALRDHPGPAPAGLSDAVMRRIRHAPQPGSGRPARAVVLRLLPAAAAAILVASVVVLLRKPVAPTAPQPPAIRVELQLASAKARTVAVAGDFNGWDEVAMNRGDDGVWRVSLAVRPGRYRYAFLVDHDAWVADPRAATVLESGYAGADSVLDLPL